MIQSKEQQAENESCGLRLHLSAHREEEKVEAKCVNVSICLFIKRKNFTVSITFHTSFPSVGDNIFQFTSEQAKHRNTKEKMSTSIFPGNQY